jgi:hypothetical protein
MAMLWWVLATFEKTTSRFQSGPAINKWPNKSGLNKTNKSEDKQRRGLE